MQQVSSARNSAGGAFRWEVRVPRVKCTVGMKAREAFCDVGWSIASNSETSEGGSGDPEPG